MGLFDSEPLSPPWCLLQKEALAVRTLSFFSYPPTVSQTSPYSSLTVNLPSSEMEIRAPGTCILSPLQDHFQDQLTQGHEMGVLGELLTLYMYKMEFLFHKKGYTWPKRWQHKPTASLGLGFLETPSDRGQLQMLPLGKWRNGGKWQGSLWTELRLRIRFWIPCPTWPWCGSEATIEIRASPSKSMWTSWATWEGGSICLCLPVLGTLPGFLCV